MSSPLRLVPRAMPMLRFGDHVELASVTASILSSSGDLIFAEGMLYRFDGTIWEALTESEVYRTVSRFSGEPLTDKKNKPLALRDSDIKGAIRALQHKVANESFFENAPSGVAFKNCFVCLANDEIVTRSHSADNKARYCYPFDYEPSKKPEKFLTFLREVIPTEDAIESLRQYAGSAILGIAGRWQRGVLLRGDGRNGKGVTTKVIRAAMPAGSVTSITPDTMGNEYNRASLAGKRLNLVSELPDRDIVASESFKAIVACDEIRGRHIFGKPFDFTPVAGHLWSTNPMPGTKDQSNAFWQRWIVIDFPNEVPVEKRDPDLVNKLITEVPEIVSWLIEGASLATAIGSLTIPQSSTDTIAEWQKEADPLRRWVEECCEPTAPDYGTKSRVLFRSFAEWCKDGGYGLMSETTFGRRMKSTLKIKCKRLSAGVSYAIRVI